jgi:hypothetical protein
MTTRYRPAAGPASPLAAIAVLAAGLALAGCGGAKPGAQAAKPGAPAASATPPPLFSTGGPPAPADRNLASLHACALVPAATVAAAIGQLEEPPHESSDGLTCFYNTRQDSESAGPSYILSIMTRSMYEVEKSVTDGEAQARLVQVVPIRGIGDEGYSTANSKGGPVYNAMVAKGGAAAGIMVDSVFPASERGAQRMLAVAVAGL